MLVSSSNRTLHGSADVRMLEATLTAA